MRAAVRAGVVGNLVDQIDIFLPVIALAAVPAMTGRGVVGPGLVFVATMLGRPVGALLLGPVADRAGRARTSRVCLVGVGLTTGAVAFLPADGRAALPVLLLRLLGGVFLGGQYSAAIPYALEHCAPRLRGHVSGLAMAMSPTANAAIAASTLALQNVLGDDYARWGWRVLFVVGAVLPLALAASMRALPQAAAHAGTAATAEAPTASPRRAGPLHELARGRRDLLQVLVLMSGLWLFTNMAVAVLTPRLKATGIAPTAVTTVMLVATAASAPAMLALGAWSTRLGRRRVFVGFAAVALVAAPLAYLATVRAHGGGLVVAAVALQLVTVTAYGPVGAYLAERFPAAARSTGYGVAYSVSLVLPALYPWYLPPLQALLGVDAAVAALLALGAVLLGVGALAGPATDAAAPLP